MSSGNTFFAHTTEREDQADWQPLQEHLEATATLAETNAAPFGCGNMAKTMGLLHDLGKYSTPFQRRLQGESGKVDHSTRGAMVAAERYSFIGKLLAYGVAGHHAGLANGRDQGTRTPLAERLNRDVPHLNPAWEDEIPLPETAPEPEAFSLNPDQRSFQFSMMGRMLFSSLVDADYRDTEAFYTGIEGTSVERTGFPSLETLREELDKTLSGFTADTEVNELRLEILNHARNESEQSPGLFSMTVPTGGGKTLTSLAFALDHAIRHGLRRVIFVIPFTSIVEQNAAVFRQALGPYGDTAVLEHHSAYQDDGQKAPEAADKLKKAMENWEAPVVVTTSVQFFESLFGDRPSQCRKLHNISGSVVILDEAQTLPLKLLRPCVAAIDELARNYRTSLVLCTATQPALKAGDEFKGGLENVRELAPDRKRIFDRLKRVTLRHIGDASDEDIAGALKENDQALCIVNNRRHARCLYERIADEPGAYHLTTLMCARHRSEMLAEIRERLLEGLPCRLVSTSLIEAGVDVDFPLILRAETGLDSIAQAAGRCNREGKRASEDSEVRVFTVADDWPMPPELKQFAQAARAIFRQFDDPLALEAINAYFRELYWQKDKELDANDILGRVNRSQVDNLPFEWVSDQFRMIESTMIPIIIPYDDEARDAIKTLEYADRIGGISRRLQSYLVQIPEQGYKALKSAGAVQPIRQEEFGEQFLVLVNEDLYHPRYGLNWDDSVFIRAENSVL
ncbi:CRISPR-associated endonuclease Cas3'' [Vreelandella utahensis]|uniref:CRISPR-associated endonuclease Cas3'' n=1 Tax=Vreelandella halophila TaxID=86177 RepID=UPI00098780CD|nr:CRISPR-associated endonuclease Cas3'' [Halomonas utahensis]